MYMTMNGLYKYGDPLAVANNITNMGAQIFNSLALTTVDIVGPTNRPWNEDLWVINYMKSRYGWQPLQQGQKRA